MKKEQIVGARLPEDLVRELAMIESIEQTDRSSTVRRLLSRAVREWKREHFAREYGAGRLTLARAAQDAGVSLWEMIDYLRQQKIAAQYDLADLKEDLADIAGDSRSLGDRSATVD